MSTLSTESSLQQDSSIPVKTPVVDIKTKKKNVSNKEILDKIETVQEFTQNSTLHGVRYLFQPETFVIRKLLWLVLVLLCMGLMSYQIIDRIIYYYTWPVTVNVEVNYNKSLVFPSVTICNQNQFRISKASQIGQYELLDSLYTRTGPVNSTFLRKYQANNLTFYKLFTSVSHQKEDLIVSCSWGGELCGPENFTMVITDHGVCYTFSQESNGALRKAATTGADNGLRLLLNVEQYEYMPGPHDAAGVKILMHNNGEFPKVHELGLATPTGTHAFVGLKIVSLSNLPEPRGNCSSKDLKFFPDYTPENCEIDCFTEHLHKICNCRLKFMPHKYGVPPVCTLQQYFECYLPKRDEILYHVRRYCTCPIPCNTILYDPSVSYASTSSYAVDSLLTKVTSGDVENKFLRAREVSNRVVVERFNHTKQLITKLAASFSNLKRLFDENINDRIDKQVKLLSNFYNDTTKQAKTKQWMNKYQTYAVEKNFLRVREAMEERTLKYLAFDYLNFIYIIENRLRELAGNELTDKTIRKFLYVMIVNSCKANIEKGNKAMGNYTELLGSFQNGTPIFNYKYKATPRSHNIYIVPKPLLSRALTHSSYAIKYTKKLPQWIKRVQDSLQMYIDLANETFINHTLNETRMAQISEAYNKACKNYNFAKSAFYFYSVDWSKEQVEQKELVTSALLEKYENIANDMKFNLQNLESLLRSLQNTIMHNLTVTGRLAIDYLNASTSKRSLAKIFTSASIRQGINELKTFFIEIRARGSTLFDSWNKLAMASVNIWENILNDVDLVDYYTFLNQTEYLQGLADVTKHILDQHDKARDENDLRELVGNTDRIFLYRLENVIEEMAAFEESLKMDTDFLRENFLELAIFYRELSYEQITQQVAYDIFSLFCDIGGSMGLFIGASVLTIFEIVEFIFNQSLRMAFLQKKKK